METDRYTKGEVQAIISYRPNFQNNNLENSKPPSTELSNGSDVNDHKQQKNKTLAAQHFYIFAGFQVNLEVFSNV